MTRWTQAVLRRRRVIGVGWLVLAVVGLWAAATLSPQLSASFDAPGRPAFMANERIVEDYGTGGTIAPLVLVATADDRVPAGRVATALRDVASSIPESRVVTGDPALSSRDGRVRAALVFPTPGRSAPDENPAALSAARDAAERVSRDGLQVQVTGIGALSGDDGSSGGAGLLLEILIGAAGAAIVLALVFGSWLAFVPLLMAAVSILTTFLLLRGLAAVTEISFVVQFLVGLIGLGVAIDYALLLVVRWREERDGGADPQEAVVRAMDTAGRAVVTSGTTVAIGLLALVVVPVPFIRSIGVGGLLIPLVSVAATLSLLPGILITTGARLDRRREGRERVAGAGWTRWATWVLRRRWLAAATGTGVLLALVVAAADLRPGQPSLDALSTGGSARDALVTLERSGLGAGTLTPVEVISDEAEAARNVDALERVDGVRAVLAPEGDRWRRADTTLLAVLLLEDSASGAGRRTFDAVRGLERDGLGVGGVAAQDRDLTDAIYGSFPVMVGLIALLTFGLLARSLRSVLLPLKAILLNVLSIGASFGVIVLVWQQGLGSELLGGVPATGAVTTWVPLAMFAFLFGLSMDYEVFILSRMREEFDASGSTSRAVIDGLSRTGRLVTSAALILFFAFVALGAGPNTDIKTLATGLAAGIALDATIVRALIVPALVSLFGDANWWRPGTASTTDR